MPVVVTAATVFFAVIYFRRVRAAFVKQGIVLGCLWYVINVAIDLPLMLSPPMTTGFVEYMADIGLTYLVIPAVTIGIGFTRAQAEPDQ